MRALGLRDFKSNNNDNSDMDQQERIAAASRFLVQSPPGEINDVLNGMSLLTLFRHYCVRPCLVCSSIRVFWSTDVRDIIADDEALQAGILPSLEQYNLEQFITADVPDCDYQVCSLVFRPFLRTC